MHLVQILLPLHDNEGNAFGDHEFPRIRRELTERFGGLTVYTRAPAVGLWKSNGGAASREDIVIFEVMADDLEPDWWTDYRQTIEKRLRQEMLVVRAQEIRLL